MKMVIQERASVFDGVMAFILLMINYRKKGYFPTKITWKNICTLLDRFCEYMNRVHMFFLDQSHGQVIVAKKYGIVVGTVSAWFNPRITPIDDIFPKELASLRNSGKSFVYLNSFAVASPYKCTRLSLRMLRIIWSMAQHRKTDVGICVVHPDHRTFYERFGFKLIASSVIPELGDAPAALLVIKRQDVLL
jgi:hypothetical protein